ncbi:Hypothetical protein (Fragment) [Durusdinium trenchii]|uniref:Uncharacterized protein n=1 Tax=Durusdinium trenchii TaxID=1381693 RepID=A0ABP0MK13_9DINO
MSIPDADGAAATVGRSEGYWLSRSDFIWSHPSDDLDVLGALSFPREWPKSYSSEGLKSLIGKRGKIPAKRVAVAGVPTAEQLDKLRKVLESCRPLQSFHNAELAAQLGGLHVVRGWAIFERRGDWARGVVGTAGALCRFFVGRFLTW